MFDSGKTQKDYDNELKKNDALEYLKSTDWYSIRQSETGKEIPVNVLELRAAARLLL